MSSRSLWKRKSFLFFIALIAILIVLAPFSLANTDVSHMDIKQISKYDNGSTVFAGDELIDNTKVNKYPLAINLNYLGSQILSGDLIGGVFSIMTGTVPVPASELVSGNVSDNGLVADFNGNYIATKNGKVGIIDSNKKKQVDITINHEKLNLLCITWNVCGISSVMPKYL